MDRITYLCNKINGGYAAGKSGMDDGMIDRLIELGDLAERIMAAVQFQQAVDEAMVAAHIGVAEGDARECLNRLLAWNQQVALDPRVSSEAQALVDQLPKPDMFWNDADPEEQRDSILQIVDEAYGEGSVAFGDVMTIQQAIRLPNIKVRVIPESDDPEYPTFEFVEPQEPR